MPVLEQLLSLCDQPEHEGSELLRLWVETTEPSLTISQFLVVDGRVEGKGVPSVLEGLLAEFREESPLRCRL